MTGGGFAVGAGERESVCITCNNGNNYVVYKCFYQIRHQELIYQYTQYTYEKIT